MTWSGDHGCSQPQHGQLLDPHGISGLASLTVRSYVRVTRMTDSRISYSIETDQLNDQLMSPEVSGMSAQRLR